jgi:hypothetical protein
MPNYTARGLQTPLLTDPADVPAAMEALAASIEAMMNADLTMGGKARATSFGAGVAAEADIGYLGVFSAGQWILVNRLAAGHAQGAFAIKGDGTLHWGAGGSTLRDTNLYRSGANKLKTDDSLEVAGELTVGGKAALVRDGGVTAGSTTPTGFIEVSIGGTVYRIAVQAID